MPQLISTLSSKGQVTVPIAVRRHLKVTASDRVAFVIEPTGEVKLTPAQYPDLKSLQGIAGSLKKPLAWKEMKKIADEDRLK